MNEEYYQKLIARGLRTDKGCLIWPGATTGTKRHPYGVIGGGDQTRTLHRAVFEHVNGWLPPSSRGKNGELVISHTCGESLCFEATHLVAETQSDNLLRRTVINHPSSAKTHCPNGHEYDVVYKNGRRGCRRCDNQKSLDRYYKRQAEKKARMG